MRSKNHGNQFLGIVLILLFLAINSNGGEFLVKTGINGYVKLLIPQGWSAVTQKSKGDKYFPIVLLESSPKIKCRMTIKVVWRLPQMEYLDTTPEKMKELLIKEGEQFLKNSQEKRISLTKINGNDGIGFYSTFTDKTPKPGEFSYLTRGAMRLGDLRLLFTILSNDTKTENVQTPLQIITTASHFNKTN